MGNTAAVAAVAAAAAPVLRPTPSKRLSVRLSARPSVRPPQALSQSSTSTYFLRLTTCCTNASRSAYRRGRQPTMTP